MTGTWQNYVDKVIEKMTKILSRLLHFLICVFSFQHSLPMGLQEMPELQLQFPHIFSNVNSPTTVVMEIIKPLHLIV